MDIGEAIRMLRSGHQMTRDGWNGADQYLELQEPDEHSANTLPYVFIVTTQGERVPWVCSQTDLLAQDWWTVDRVGDAEDITPDLSELEGSPA
jgi:hypothetical protein